MSRYLVDTSVWIDFFKQRKTPAVEQLYRVLDHPDNFGITEFIYLEILQGTLNKQDFERLAEYLVSQTFFYPKYGLETYKNTAHLYYSCRSQGLTIRSTIDCLLAQIAIEHDLILLHNDKDFLYITQVVPELKLYSA